MVNSVSTMSPTLPSGVTISTQNPLIPATDDSESEIDLGLRGIVSFSISVCVCVCV